MCSGDIVLGLLALFFPPIAVWVKSGICSADSIINILLCVLGYLPGLLHAWYIISLHPEPEYEYLSLPDSERPNQGNSRVTYYYVDHQPSSEALTHQPEPQGPVPAPSPAPPGQERQYGTLPPEQAGSSRQEGEGVPPSYEQAIKGDNKVQT